MANAKVWEILRFGIITLQQAIADILVLYITFFFLHQS